MLMCDFLGPCSGCCCCWCHWWLWLAWQGPSHTRDPGRPVVPCSVRASQRWLWWLVAGWLTTVGVGQRVVAAAGCREQAAALQRVWQLRICHSKPGRVFRTALRCAQQLLCVLAAPACAQLVSGPRCPHGCMVFFVVGRCMSQLQVSCISTPVVCCLLYSTSFQGLPACLLLLVLCVEQDCRGAPLLAARGGGKGAGSSRHPAPAGWLCCSLACLLCSSLSVSPLCSVGCRTMCFWMRVAAGVVVLRRLWFPC